MRPLCRPNSVLGEIMLRLSSIEKIKFFTFLILLIIASFSVDGRAQPAPCVVEVPEGLYNLFRAEVPAIQAFAAQQGTGPNEAKNIPVHFTSICE